MDGLYFTEQMMADITGGVWENLYDDLLIKEFHHTYHYLQKGDAFVVISDNWPNPNAYKTNEHKINRAIKKGISAIIVKNDLSIDTDIPILRVENSYFAMKKLAKFASQQAKATKVLISGSYGKTGFKLHLNHIIEDQKKIYVRKNSANYAASSYCKMASIKQNSDLFLMEIPIANEDKMRRRVKLISPYISVLTSIGHENIEKYKTIENIIQHKLLIASRLPKDGKLLIPHDDRYYAQIKKEAKRYKDINLLTFGSSSRCNAHTLYKKFSNFGWDVIAKIENIVVAYRVPFFEEYAVASSLGELLAVYHLGLDVHKAADRYYSCSNFKSSGNFYEVNYQNKHFYLYDQTSRGGIEGYESLFKTFEYINPTKNGKKILVTSEFVDYEDGEMENIDIPHFQTLIEKSGFEAIYSVEKFSEHMHVISDKSIWKNHSIDYTNIQDEILNSIDNDDILVLKSIFESQLYKFFEQIQHLVGFEIQAVKHTNSLGDKNDALRGLRTINPSDIELFKRYVEKDNRMGWVHYFPFLYFWSLSSSREILMDKKEESISLFLLDKLNRSKYPRMQQYIPTLPLSYIPQKRAFNVIYKYKGYKAANIIWVDRADVVRLKEIEKQLKVTYKTSEYIYDPKIYDTLAGTKFRNIRQQLSQISKNENVLIVPYEKKYASDCLKLHEMWNTTQIDKYGKVEDEKYTKNSILHFDLFKEEDLNGLVVLQNNQVMSFGFVGKMSDRILNFFIGKSDYRLKGVQTYLKYSFLKQNRTYQFVNDGPGISRGLDNSKRMLRPVMKHKVYKARVERRG